MQGLINLHAGLSKCPEGFEAGTKLFLKQNLRLNTGSLKLASQQPAMRPATEAFFTQRLATYSKSGYLAGQILMLKHKSMQLFKQVQSINSYKSYLKILSINDKSKELKPYTSL